MRLSACRMGVVAAVLSAGQLFANDVVFLQGIVKMEDGSAPNKEAEIRLTCRGAESSRQTMANKGGKYFLKVERDDFNHVVRLLSTTTTEFNDGTVPTAACTVNAALKGYTSSAIDFGSYVIGKDLKLPDLTLKKQP